MVKVSVFWASKCPKLISRKIYICKRQKILEFPHCLYISNQAAQVCILTNFRQFVGIFFDCQCCFQGSVKRYLLQVRCNQECHRKWQWWRHPQFPPCTCQNLRFYNDPRHPGECYLVSNLCKWKNGQIFKMGIFKSTGCSTYIFDFSRAYNSGTMHF